MESNPGSNPGAPDVVETGTEDLHMIKCVVVGDTGVGKTRLICSRVCGTRYTLSQLTQTHVPTVWAIDQYRKNPQILKNSWCIVDGATVSLRLWDTFGDHSKDRRFAYGRADVVIVCFSVVQQRSLRNVVSFWCREIQELCPGVPIILCACQVDLRYMYKDPAFIKMEKGHFFHAITDKDIIFPEMGRDVAKDVHASYYETNVYEPFGVETVFANAARAALIYKRERHFWKALGTLKYISSPRFQSPHRPPKPLPPAAPPSTTCCQSDAAGLCHLLDSESFCDVEFLVRNVTIRAHRSLLVAASSTFEKLFLAAEEEEEEEEEVVVVPAPLSDVSMTSSSSAAVGELSLSETLSETTSLMTSLMEEVDSGVVIVRGNNSCVGSQVTSSSSRHHETSCRVFTTSVNCKDDAVTVAVAVSDRVKPEALQALLRFLYVGQCPEDPEIFPDIRWLSEAIGLDELQEVIDNTISEQEYMNQSIVSAFLKRRNERMKDLIIGQSLFSDVTFELDDGNVRGHRALLICRSQVMFSMFSLGFKENSSRLVAFPGVTVKVFTMLQEFLYTGTSYGFDLMESLAMIELANRLCQSDLLGLTERYLVDELTALEKSGQDIAEEVLTLLERAELYNAKYLHDWCLWYLRVNYDIVHKNCSKLLRSLQPAIQIYLTNHRWPPLWYCRELELYEKDSLERTRKKTVRSCLPLGGRCGCLSCFGGHADQRNERFNKSPVIRVSDP